VERVGLAVTYMRPGDPVVTCPSAFCGTCEWCMRGPQHCEDERRSRPAGRRCSPPTASRSPPSSASGGFADTVLVHERAIVRIPEEMSLDRAASLGCAVITGRGGALGHHLPRGPRSQSLVNVIMVG
jgi:S-(hydroxymethyl)glutathione dehydrogenase / alcohol dehydrogenase